MKSLFFVLVFVATSASGSPPVPSNEGVVAASKYCAALFPEPKLLKMEISTFRALVFDGQADFFVPIGNSRGYRLLIERELPGVKMKWEIKEIPVLPTGFRLECSVAVTEENESTPRALVVRDWFNRVQADAISTGESENGYTDLELFGLSVSAYTSVSLNSRGCKIKHKFGVLSKDNAYSIKSEELGSTKGCGAPSILALLPKGTP